jgi:uncharacterized 2Fe-2S/4Fe-4S cluster protein (DUF4445 family)
MLWMSDICRVKFVPGGEVVEVLPGISLSAAAEQAGLRMNLPCGGRGACGKCRVTLRDGGVSEPDEHELEHLSPEDLAAGVRLACRAALTGDAVVEVSPSAKVIGAKVLEAQFLEGVEVAPNAHLFTVTLPKPSLDDQRSDFQRLATEVGGACGTGVPAVDLLRALPGALRAEEYQVQATCVGGRLVDVRPASQAGRCLGVAIDIGTTTVVSYLLDLERGEILSSAALHNPQTRHGADVVSRIEFANTDPDGLATLQREALEVANETIAQALAKIGAAGRDVYEATVVGNTCMHHLFLGLDPRHLAQAPYVPVTADPVSLSAAEAGLAIHPRANVFCLPCIAGFVGADTVGMIASEKLTRQARPVLAVDIGTNGEVALWSGSRLLVASCAAGPAFEGAHIEYGMRAAPGAIDRVHLNGGDITVTTIEGAPPQGICGSGLFDAVAVALESGAVDMMGRFVAGTDGVRPEVARRLHGEGNARRLLLTGENPENGAIGLTQRDVREVQLAKGAVLAAVTLLLEEAGISERDLEEVLIAGAFGNYINPASALRIGLLPAVPLERVRGVGNAAGAGAILALVSLAEREYACEAAAVAEHIELMRRPAFQTTFMETMLFP